MGQEEVEEDNQPDSFGIGTPFFTLVLQVCLESLQGERSGLNPAPLCPCRARTREQLAALKKHHEDEITHHTKEMERLQKEIERHKQKIKKLKQHDDDD